MDVYGVKVSALTSAALLFVAFGTMAATANGALPDSAYFAAFCILGVGQIGQLHTLFSVSSLFPGYESSVVGIINGMADSAIVVFLVFNVAVLQGGIDFWVVIVAHIVGPVFMAACFAVFLWPWLPVQPNALREQAGPVTHNASGKASPALGIEMITVVRSTCARASSEEQEHTRNAAQEAPTPVEPAEKPNTTHQDAAVPASGISESPQEDNELTATASASSENSLEIHADGDCGDSDGADSEQSEHGSERTAAQEGLHADSSRMADDDSTCAGPGAASDEVEAGAVAPKTAMPAMREKHTDASAVKLVLPVPVPFTPKFPYANAAFKVQLTSPLYVYLAIFTVVNLFKFSFYLSSVDAHLNHLGQDGTTYTQIFSSLLPTGLVFVLVVGAVIDRLGLQVAVAANLTASILLSVVTLIPVLEVQVVGFILFALFRAHLFTVLTSILAAEFTFGSFGRLIGIASLVAALVGLLNSPLFDLAVNTFDGDFTVANAILLVATIVIQLPFAVFYWRYRGAADQALFTETSVAAGFAMSIPKPPAAIEGGRAQQGPTPAAALSPAVGQQAAAPPSAAVEGALESQV